MRTNRNIIQICDFGVICTSTYGGGENLGTYYNTHSLAVTRVSFGSRIIKYMLVGLLEQHLYTRIVLDTYLSSGGD